MSKKIKLDLEELEVQSFVTSLSPEGALTFKGGAQSLNPEDTENHECCRDLTLPQSSCQLCGPGPVTQGGCVTGYYPLCP